MTRPPDAGHTMTDYEAERRNFSLEVPPDFNWAFDVIDRWAGDPGHEAMFWVGNDGGERRLTFADFKRRSNQLANVLEALGVRRGDRVFLMLPRLVEWWEAILGIMKVGAVSMPATTLLTPKDIAYRANLAETRVVITDAANAAKFDEVRAQCPSFEVLIVVGGERAGWVSYEPAVAAAADARARLATPSADPCMIYFTSGTVGYPKMVLHTHASYPIGHTITGKYWLDLRPGDLHWNMSETGWAKAAWSNLFGPWNMGASLFIYDGRGKFNPRETLEFLQKYPVTTFCAPPTIYRMLVLEDLGAYSFAALRHCTGAGEPLNPEVIDTWRAATGLTIRDGYGQTETVLLCANFPPLEVKPGSMGKPSPGFDVAVVDHDGAILPPGKEGDIGVRIAPERPLGLFREYWRNPDATAGCIRGDWYITGDRAIVDEDGYFWFVGRADDVILSAGYRIGPFEVESALVEHPAVAEAAVVASPDDLRGEVVKAFVILAPGHSPSDALAAELQEYVKGATAPYKYPREIEFVAELPKTISGKIRRVELRERERQKKQAG
ncbi:AMP-binding protein [Kouleothrix sp.]|uniref:AMP-binding protein n=1 Tax=Kouleothrix sp. TaxID=2779161 RepID=UPI00391CC824